MAMVVPLPRMPPDVPDALVVSVLPFMPDVPAALLVLLFVPVALRVASTALGEVRRLAYRAGECVNPAFIHFSDDGRCG